MPEELYKKKVMEFYQDLSKNELREKLSQFLTPKEEALKMLEDLEIIEKKELKILEPSCGYGILVLTLLKKIFGKYRPDKIKIVLCDIDLEMVMTSKKIIELFFKDEEDTSFEIEILNEDFLNLKIDEKYDYIISNPPYKKTNIGLVPENLKKYLNGQPNIYLLFMAKSLEMLGEEGKYICITPKNYLSGKYSQKLREYIFQSFSLTKIHVFSERNRNFGKSILQELCISHIEKSSKNKILLSYDNNEKMLINKKDILLERSLILQTPRNVEDIELLKKFTKFKLGIIGKEIFFKPGKVVQFRVKNREESLSESKFDTLENYAPLIIYRHINKNEMNYKNIDGKKIAISKEKNNKSLLIPNGNYIILRKNIEKTYSKIISGIIYEPKYFNAEKIGIDNNLAYFTNADNSLSAEEVIGIYCILNSQQFDNYYRTLNSSHTINTYEFENMYFPDMDVLRDIGKKYRDRDLTIALCTKIINKLLN